MRLWMSLRQPHLTVLWLGQLLSAIGDQMYGMVVIWLAVHTPGSDAGLIVGIQYGSLLLFGLLGGVYADRWERARTMIGSDLLRLVVVASLPLAGMFGPIQVWHLYIVAFLIGALGSLFEPALEASLPHLAVNPPALLALNGLMDTTQRFARLVGPGLVTLLALFIPMLHLYTLDALTFGVSALTVWWVSRGRSLGRTETVRRPASPWFILVEIGRATRLVAGQPLLLWMLAGSLASNILWGVCFTLGVPLLITQKLGGDLGSYGLIVAVYGVSNLLGSFVANTWRVKRPPLVIFGGAITFGLGFLLIGLADNLALAVLGAFIAAFGPPSSDLHRRTLLQQSVASADLGKAFSLYSFVSMSGYVLALLTGTTLLRAGGLTLTIELIAALLIVVNLPGLIFGKQAVATAQPVASLSQS